MGLTALEMFLILHALIPALLILSAGEAGGCALGGPVPVLRAADDAEGGRHIDPRFPALRMACDILYYRRSSYER